MRYYPETDSDREDAAELNAEPWMIECLRLNPSYCSWGNFEDYMSKKPDTGWDGRCDADTVEEGLWNLDTLNECVNFYFEVTRSSKECESCGGSGYNPETKKIADDWYDFEHTGRRWYDKITDHEVNALWNEGRLKSEFSDKPAADRVNDWVSRGRGIGHDAINRMICVQARAEQQGVYGHCDCCSGKGYVFTEPTGRLALQLWMLHPRKGCSRGIYIKTVQQADLPKIYTWLRSAAERNAERFAAIPA